MQLGIQYFQSWTQLPTKYNPMHAVDNIALQQSLLYSQY